MDIMELGAIGELVGGVAVIGSLLYVGLQVRQNTNAIRSATFQALSQQSADLNLAIAGNDTLRRTLSKVQKGEAIEDDEVRLAGNLVTRAVMRNQENQYYQYQRGFLEPEIWEGYLFNLREGIQLPLVRNYWQDQREGFGRSFRNLVDQEFGRSTRVP